jgi:hypothetical protein
MKHDYPDRDIATSRAVLDDCIAAAHCLAVPDPPAAQQIFWLSWFFIRGAERCRRLRDYPRAFDEPQLEVSDYEEAAQMHNRPQPGIGRVSP